MSTNREREREGKASEDISPRNGRSVFVYVLPKLVFLIL